MMDLVGIPSFLRIALWVAMATMHFHIAQTDVFGGNIFFAFRVSKRTIWQQLKIVLG